MRRLSSKRQLLSRHIYILLVMHFYHSLNRSGTTPPRSRTGAARVTPCAPPTVVELPHQSRIMSSHPASSRVIQTQIMKLPSTSTLSSTSKRLELPDQSRMMTRHPASSRLIQTEIMRLVGVRSQRGRNAWFRFCHGGFWCVGAEIVGGRRCFANSSASLPPPSFTRRS